MLSPSHRRELEQASAISPAVIAERGYRTLASPLDRDELAALGINIRLEECFPGLLLPLFRATGERISTQFKPAKPFATKGRLKPAKYLSPRGQGNCLDVHPQNRAHVRDVRVPLWITEGVKKGDSLTSRGCCVVTLTGVFNWRDRFGTLGDWEDIPIKGREVMLCFDADARKNMNVARAMVRLGRWCWSKGAKRVHYVIVPSDVKGTLTKGVDDYFAADGTLDTLLASATTEPDTEVADDTFSDARLAETVADEVLADRFVWCKALGWMGWSGTHWDSVTEERVGEAVRRFVLRRFGQAFEIGRKDARQGWHSILGAARQHAVLGLTKGIVERTADAFDADPDLLNTPSGTVDLRTGQVLPHDPDLLVTKVTRGVYSAGYTHPDWEQALTALDEDVRPWLQVRVGQGITGHPTPDGVIPIAQGGGENGKSAVTTDGIVPALGDYAAPVSAKLVAAAKDEHSTERADLRGQRFLIAEELTEDRALNITAIKQITDVSQIKARKVFRDNSTFTASHSLFMTTNYVPVVNETDHGTWRRLALVRFRFTFQKPGEPLTGQSDRRGDPQLKERIRAGAGGQHDAIVTWAVEGAQRWYQGGFPPLPPIVEKDTRAWRRTTDRILGFWDDCLFADQDASVLTTDLLQAFNAWMEANGHNKWSKELFGSRFGSHAETARHNVEARRPRNRHKLNITRPSGVTALEELPERPYVWVGVRFRRLDEIGDDSEKSGESWSKRSDPIQTSTRDGDQDEAPTGSDRSDRMCCEGGALQLHCRLCRHSSTYWQRVSEVAR